MTKETAKAIKQLIPNQDKALMMASSINNAISLLKKKKGELIPFYYDIICFVVTKHSIILLPPWM